MTDFNMWTWNSRVFPGIDSLPVRLGDREFSRKIALPGSVISLVLRDESRHE